MPAVERAEGRLVAVTDDPVGEGPVRGVGNRHCLSHTPEWHQGTEALVAAGPAAIPVGSSSPSRASGGTSTEAS